jgi:hypothetical protein
MPKRHTRPAFGTVSTVRRHDGQVSRNSYYLSIESVDTLGTVDGPSWPDPTFTEKLRAVIPFRSFHSRMISLPAAALLSTDMS